MGFAIQVTSCGLEHLLLFFPASIDIFFTTVMLFLWLGTTVGNIGFLQAVQDIGHGSYSDGILQWKFNV